MRFLGLMLIQHPHRRPTRTVGASAENSRLKNCRVCVLLRDARAVLVQAMDTDGCLRNRQVSVKWITMSLPIMRKPKTYRWQRLSTGHARHSLRSIRTLKQNTGETDRLSHHRTKRRRPVSVAFFILCALHHVRQLHCLSQDAIDSRVRLNTILLIPHRQSATISM